MISCKYQVLRRIRHYLPDWAARLLLRHRWVIRPGLETLEPQQAVNHYQASLASHGVDLKGKRVMIFGYGGNLDVACMLLNAGAAHLVLVEKPGFPMHFAGQASQPLTAACLQHVQGKILPDPARITLLHDDITRATLQQIAPVDVVLSSSVFEHLGEVEAITGALARFTRPDGVHLHLIDLRDHYFAYPFEMLCYDEKTWKKRLNPGSNLNRWRLGDYRQVFEQNFENSSITVIEHDTPAFLKTKSRIMPQFLSGEDELDAVTIIQVFAACPKPRH